MGDYDGPEYFFAKYFVSIGLGETYINGGPNEKQLAKFMKKLRRHKGPIRIDFSSTNGETISVNATSVAEFKDDDGKPSWRIKGPSDGMKRPSGATGNAQIVYRPSQSLGGITFAVA